ncbi:hypothetical protein A2215_00480 [Candidatus Berkelbacteria bacterium RIFOXYA2_FULL_43_10]|uniref:DOD-type homing endonuclease domain-containing protein n=1 Tax=Candidatus Berkelbacteria bacterium RIFOXYA2_FULL_43_10 TaxID=1797472 RepID=A0A1F5E441_9BACT|nr:MAG: hypothetical protein A2215_00480 [Candidatus Berkelbacteria bacterium RIFOXYA2_FULL_43_10]
MDIVKLKQPTAEQREKNRKFKIAISYPPMPSEKGIPLLGQNRQFQWFNNPTFIYPMVPAYAASLLKSQGYDVMWDDGIAEEMEPEEWLERLKKFKPNLVAMETKTPVVKRHWKVIDALKEELPDTKVVLFGDHVTAMPEESMENSKVDVVITGGDYDFLLLSVANSYNHKEKLEAGVYYRRKIQDTRYNNQTNPKSQIPNPKKLTANSSKLEAIVKNSGHFLLNHDLDDLPLIDRELTRWELYAYKNGNYKRTPGTYTYFARDCWWGRCAFCLSPEAKITTQNDFVAIGDVVDKKKSLKTLTHKNRYQKITDWHKRIYEGNLIELETHYLAEKLKLTSNHSVFICKSEGKNNPKISGVPAEEVQVGDYLSVPIDKKVKDIQKIKLSDVIAKEILEIKTTKKISQQTIERIESLTRQGASQRQIAKDLKIDRETVRRYLVLSESDELIKKINPLVKKSDKIRFEGGKNKVLDSIKLDNSFLRFVGYYLAEGHVTRIKNRPNSAILGLTFSSNEKEYIKDADDIFRQSFQTSLNVNENKVNHTVQLTLGSSVLARTFELLFGTGSGNKELPAEFMTLPIEKQRQLLTGLFRGDGHVRKERKKGGQELIYSTVSEKLARQVYMLLLRQNIIASFRMPKFGKKTKSQNYSIHIYGKDIQRFFPLPIVIKQQHNQRGFIYKDFAMLPVKNISNQYYRGPVYNITVEDDHSYVVGFFAVKNCSWTTLYPGKDYRKVSVKRALDEVGMLIDKYRVREIMDDSGTFPVGPWLKEFCEGMIERGYNKKIRFDCNMRLKGLKQEDYDLMGKAGFRFILYGLESANQNTLDRINKNLKVEEIEKGVKMAKQGGLEPHITTMMGYPWETLSDAKRTVALSKKLFDKGYVDTLQATIVIPYPGTPLYRECKESGWLTTEDWDEFDQRMAVMKSPLTEKDIKELTQELYKSFMTPRFIWRKIIGIRSLSDIKFLIRAGGKVIGHLADFSARKQNS